MNEWMNEWTNERTNEWRNEWMNVCMYVCMYACMYVCGGLAALSHQNLFPCNLVIGTAHNEAECRAYPSPRKRLWLYVDKQTALRLTSCNLQLHRTWNQEGIEMHQAWKRSEKWRKLKPNVLIPWNQNGHAAATSTHSIITVQHSWPRSPQSTFFLGSVTTRRSKRMQMTSVKEEFHEAFAAK